MENQAEIRQSTGKNITDFIKGATLGLLHLPVHLYQTINGGGIPPLSKKERSLSFRSGYLVAGAGIILTALGYLGYKILSSHQGTPETL